MASLIRRMLSAVARSTNLHPDCSIAASDPAACAAARTPLPEPAISGEQLAATAEDQFQSYFFGRLPLEIRRQIYEELWRTTSADQHVFFHRDGRLARCACITDHDAADERDDIVEHFRSEKALTNETTYFADSALHRQLSSSWTKHWKCEEHLAKHGAKERSPFLSPLLTCKRMYFECLESIGENVTLNFTSLAVAHDFLVARRHAPIVQELRRFNFSFYLSREEINTYTSWGASQWSELWQALNGLAHARQVKLWLDGRLGSDQQDLQLNGPALFRCLGQAPTYQLAVNLPTDAETEDRLTDPWGPRYAMDCFQGVDLQFRGAPAYRPSDKKGVCGPANNAMPSLEVMAWYSMSMHA